MQEQTNMRPLNQLIDMARDGDESALAELFNHYKSRLRTMIDIRMDPRVRARVDPSDVLQEAFIYLAKRLPDYAKQEAMPFYVWLRLIAGERLQHAHRRHLGTAKRNAGREVSLFRKPVPEAESMALAANLVGRFTSAAHKAIRTELQHKLQESLNTMDEVDREVLVLRHFEELSNLETAEVLEISPAAASKRYVRALGRFRTVLEQYPELME